MRNAGLDEAQAEIKIAGRNINNLRYAEDTTLMAESEEELKSLLIKVKEARYINIYIDIYIYIYNLYILYYSIYFIFQYNI